MLAENSSHPKATANFFAFPLIGFPERLLLILIYPRDKTMSFSENIELDVPTCSHIMPSSRKTREIESRLGEIKTLYKIPFTNLVNI